jgi:hypothetical protein
MYSRRAVVAAAVAAALAPLIAQAHHGWSSFDQERPLYLAGTVEAVKWENPHVVLTVRPADTLAVPADLAMRSMPAQEQPVDAAAILPRTTAVSDVSGTWTVELAPLPRMQAWDVSAIAPGTSVELVGYSFPADRAERIMRVEFLLIDGKAYSIRSMPKR